MGRGAWGRPPPVVLFWPPLNRVLRPMEVIPLPDVLKEIENKQPFTLTFCTCDQGRKRGGELLTYEHVVLAGKYYKEGIRNVTLPNGKTRPVHIRLITHFN